MAPFSRFLGIYLVEHFRQRRLITVIAGTTARPMLPIIVADGVVGPAATLMRGRKTDRSVFQSPCR